MPVPTLFAPRDGCRTGGTTRIKSPKRETQKCFVSPNKDLLATKETKKFGLVPGIHDVEI